MEYNIVLILNGEETAIRRHREENPCRNEDVGIRRGRSKHIGIRQEIEIDESPELQQPEKLVKSLNIVEDGIKLHKPHEDLIAEQPSAFG